jgi:hypothetical protein
LQRFQLLKARIEKKSPLMLDLILKERISNFRFLFPRGPVNSGNSRENAFKEAARAADSAP